MNRFTHGVPDLGFKAHVVASRAEDIDGATRVGACSLPVEVPVRSKSLAKPESGP